MSSRFRFMLVVAAPAVLGIACSSNTPGTGSGGSGRGTGGAASSGTGATGTGGVAGSAGMTSSTGGAGGFANGGAGASSSASASGGRGSGGAGGGGAAGGGGVSSSGGAAGGGDVSSGGSSGNGGSSGSGGSSGQTGDAALGGRTGPGTGGASGTAGITGSAGAPSTGGMSGGGGTACTPPQGTGGGNTTCSPPAPPSAKDSVTLDMAVAQGAPTYLASGFIYGIAEDGTQPPTSLLSDIKVKGFRAGRGQSEGCGAQAWATHWNVIKAYYSRAKEVGATYLLLVSDDYGYFCTWPGDGGDWTGLTTFMTQLISNVQAAGMTGPDVRWELWNEPELSLFWNGTQAQWLETWKHAYQQIRAAIPGAVIEGPSLATGPGGSWMNTFLDYAKTNDVMPDYISWHEEGGGADPVADLATINRQLTSRGITGVKGFDANEYGTTGEQNPGHSAWFLARFDRAGFQGLRGNWADATFFSNMAELVAANWQPNSQYWVYKRYADQTGLRTTVTAGTQVDAVAYQDACAAKSIIVVGNKGGVTGAVNVVIKNIPAWLQSGGSTKVLLEKMPTGNAALTAPVVVTNAAATVTCNAMTVTIDWTTATDGYVVTLSPP